MSWEKKGGNMSTCSIELNIIFFKEKLKKIKGYLCVKWKRGSSLRIYFKLAKLLVVFSLLIWLFYLFHMASKLCFPLERIWRIKKVEDSRGVVCRLC